MPIHGKTDKRTVSEKVSLRVTYRLWKGSERQPLFNKDGSPRLDKFERQLYGSGEDLNNRFRFSSDDKRLEAMFLDAYKTLEPEQVRIFLPYQESEDCFETYMEKYTGQSIQRRCDGRRIIQEKVRKEYKVLGKKGDEVKYTWQMQDVDLPCVKVANGLPKCPDCSQQGRLYFYIAELYSSGSGSTNCGMLSLHGDIDLGPLATTLYQLQEKYYGSLMSSPVPTPWTFGYIPFVLTRQRREIMKAAGASQTRGEAWAVSISEDPAWLACLQRWQQAVELKQLAAGSSELRELLLPNLGLSQPLQLAAANPDPLPDPDVTLNPPIDNWRQPKEQLVLTHVRRLGLTHSALTEKMRSLYGHQGRSIQSLSDLSDLELEEFGQWLKKQRSLTVEPSPAFDVEATVVELATTEEVKALWKLAQESGWENGEELRSLLAAYGCFDAQGAPSMKTIPRDKLDNLMNAVSSPDVFAQYHQVVDLESVTI